MNAIKFCINFIVTAIFMILAYVASDTKNDLLLAICITGIAISNQIYGGSKE